MGGVLDTAPGVAGLFLIAALSLAGMPPFSGFVAKLLLVRAGLAGGHWLIVLVSLLTGLLTLYSMSKIWMYAFWRSPEGPPVGDPRDLLAPTAALVALTIALGVGAQPLLRIATSAARDLVDPQPYVDAVLRPSGAAHAPVETTNAAVAALPEER